MSIYNIKKKVTKKKFPYKVVRVVYDQPVDFPSLKEKREYATSEGQAMILFTKKYPFLEDYASMGYVLRAIPDNDLAKKEEEIEIRRNEEREEEIQNAWWQN